MYRIYFKEVRGEIRLGKLAGQAVRWKGGCYDTNDPLMLSVAQASPLVDVIEPLGDTPALDVPIKQVTETTTDIAYVQCRECNALVRPAEIDEHRRSHGRLPKVDTSELIQPLADGERAQFMADAAALVGANARGELVTAPPKTTLYEAVRGKGKK